jgi:hypothetical protein
LCFYFSLNNFIKDKIMSQVIIFSNENGGVSTTIPTGEISIEAVLAKDCPKGAIIVEQSSLPQGDGAFFYDAWELADGVVTVSLPKAKELTKKRLRAEREPLLAAQDVAFQRALESGENTTAIVAEKNRLRDITGLVDAVTTLEGLRAIKAGV